MQFQSKKLGKGKHERRPGRLAEVGGGAVSLFETWGAGVLVVGGNKGRKTNKKERKEEFDVKPGQV